MATSKTESASDEGAEDASPSGSGAPSESGAGTARQADEAAPTPATPQRGSATSAPPLGRWLALVGCVVAASAAYSVYSGALVIPDRFNPWAPLDTHAPPNFLTGFKLSRARATPASCLAALAKTGLRYESIADRVTAPGCGFENAVRLRGDGKNGVNDANSANNLERPAISLGGPLTLSCPMALSLSMWERHALQPAARLYFGAPVVSIDNFGSYACRNVNTGDGAAPNAAGGRRSRHATANAFDIAGFTLADGSRVSVLKDWRSAAAGSGSGSGAAAALLREAHRGACRWFDGVLGPDYNAVHRDHFHLETGGWHSCR